MSNPFTESLIRQIKNDSIVRFVSYWDRLEALVIRVYKGKDASADDEREWSQIRTWLQKEVPGIKDVLHPFWQGATIGGEPAREDPFERLISFGQARDFLGNWAAMQTLPAARQALNQWLVELIRKQTR
jgi:hypothetical protein